MMFHSIVLVDDNKASNYLSKILLTDMQLAPHIYPFTEPEAALTHIRQTADPSVRSSHYPQLLLLDINMPRMSGFEFLDQLLAMPEISGTDQTICMLTSSDYYKDKERARSYPIHGYITQPLTEEKVTQALSTRPDGK